MSVPKWSMCPTFFLLWQQYFYVVPSFYWTKTWIVKCQLENTFWKYDINKTFKGKIMVCCLALQTVRLAFSLIPASHKHAIFKLNIKEPVFISLYPFYPIAILLSFPLRHLFCFFFFFPAQASPMSLRMLNCVAIYWVSFIVALFLWLTLQFNA